MIIVITNDNVRTLKSRINPDVTVLFWKIGKINETILKMFPNVIELCCMNNNLTSLKGISVCKHLKILNCSNNKLKTLDDCEMLEEIVCSDNLLKSLNSISECKQLKKLVCSHNKIKTLRNVECNQLRFLDISNNKLMTLDGLDNLTELENIDCSMNRLKCIQALKYVPKLSNFQCQCNELETLDGIQNHEYLTILICHSNMLKTLIELEGCSNLRCIVCSNNDLSNLNGIQFCPNVRELSCSANSINNIDNIRFCTLLEKFSCYDCLLVSLNGIEHCRNIRIMMVGSNRISSLKGLENCTLLERLYCSDNMIRDLSPLVYLNNLINMEYSRNPLDIQTIQVQRFLEEYQIRRRVILTNSSETIYSDTQNIHDVTIQKSVCESIVNILHDEKPVFSQETIISSQLSEKTIQALIEYCNDSSVHSIHRITFFELLSYVWARITRSEYQKEMFKILEEQISESECKCFTGRFNRILSVLVGFYDDIKIEISDKSRIGAIIVSIGQKIIPYNPIEHKNLASQALLQLGYSESEIAEWIEAIE